ncbi:hypothetical protein F4777DRAFT_555374 [Nemania sp. FL0916]|nr:hypothetical protein F4777DRAFT_555374 [Nemania sp. FL0916]
MAPVQNTFSIIPNPPSALNGRNDSAITRAGGPPMTTRQVKKAYQKTNKAPRISKAEQRRRDLFEQDRIRKEFEKEKNQARAKAARDKKKEKEEQERAEKKKKGLPLVDVRPSQDTIARFIRAVPKRRKGSSASPLLEDEGESRSPSPAHTRPSSGSRKPAPILPFDDADKENRQPPAWVENGSPFHAALVEDSHGLGAERCTPHHAEHPNKKRKIGAGDNDRENGVIPSIAERVLSLSSSPDPKADAVQHHVEDIPGSDTRQDGLEVDDSFSTIDLSEEALLDDLLRESDGVPDNLNVLKRKESGQLKDQKSPPQPLSLKQLERPVPTPRQTEALLPRLEKRATPFEPTPPPHSAVLSSKISPNTSKTPPQNAVPEPPKRTLLPAVCSVPPVLGVSIPQQTVPGEHSVRPRTTMPSLPAPKFRPAEQTCASHPKITQFLKPPLPRRIPLIAPDCSPTMKPDQTSGNSLPPSTQLFILGHLDDFLPSPSQEIREIFEEPLGKHRKKNQHQSTRTPASKLALKPHPLISKSSTTSHNRSALSTPSMGTKRPTHMKQVANQPEPRKLAMKPPLRSTPYDAPTAFEMPFFSTQDLLLSSQDVKDIEEDPLPPHEERTPIPMSSKNYVKPKDAQPRSPKRFFTSSCREVRYKCALERSRSAAWESPSAQQKAREELDWLQTLEDERLEALLAHSDEEETKNKSVPITSDTARIDTARKRSVPTRPHGSSNPNPQPQPRHPPLSKSAQNSITSSGSASDDTAPGARKPLDAQRQKPRPDNSSGTGQRNTRPKGSYEAMLELLAKGPKRRPDARTDKNTDRSSHASRRKQPPQDFGTMLPIIPASQETDYGGEELDDADLLCGMG